MDHFKKLVFGLVCLVRHNSRHCPCIFPKAIYHGRLKGTVSAQKTLEGSETHKLSCLKGKKEFYPRGGQKRDWFTKQKEWNGLFSGHTCCLLIGVLRRWCRKYRVTVLHHLTALGPFLTLPLLEFHLYSGKRVGLIGSFVISVYQGLLQHCL